VVRVKTRNILLIFGFIFIAFFMMLTIGCFSIILGTEWDTGGNVAVIPIKGVIVSDDIDSVFSSGFVSSTEIIATIESVKANPSIEAVIFEINSPGGSAVASDEIGQAIKGINKTTVAWIREVGASGGYWVASSCDVIVANRMSITGSIGVFSSYLEFSGLMSDHNVTYQRLVSGDYKDMGSPFRKLTPEEENMLQTQLDKVHEFFIEEIALNRNLGIEETRQFSNGMIYLGEEARDLGLVDILGGKIETVGYIEDELGIKPKLIFYEKDPTFLEILAGVMYDGMSIDKGLLSAVISSRNYLSPISV